MSTVEIKTEPTTTTATAAVDVQVKLEPSLSAADIKLEQHSSDMDIKVESDSEADSEEGDIKSENDDDDGEDTDQFTITPKNQRQWICDHPGCGRRFISSSSMRLHQFDHMLEADINMKGKILILARESVDDQWPCPIPDCERLFRTASAVRTHVLSRHGDALKQQMPQAQITRNKFYFIDVDYFYVNGVRCGYHITTGVFICHECRLIPECLLAHLQQKHGYDKKAIDNSALPDRAVSANADPNINQHTSNSHLAAATSQPYQQHHHDIIQGWLCVTSDCDYCGYTTQNKSEHKRKVHQGEQLLTVPALILRLTYKKTQALYFLIARIDQASGAVTASSNRVNQHKPDYSHSGLNAQDENGDDFSRNETTEPSNWKSQFSCEYNNCGILFNSAGQLSAHRREHKLEVVVNVYGTSYTLTRQSVDGRWPCPVPDCETKCRTIHATRMHVQNTHLTATKQKRANMEDSSQKQQIIKRRLCTIQYLKSDDFYISGTKCGYHTTTGVFMCYGCKLVPKCLLTHLQQRHGYDGKSIDNSVLPDSARITGSDPNGNQHTSNSHLALAIREPSQLQPSDIVQGWLCIAPNCGCCGYINKSRNEHQRKKHKGKQLLIVPALVLRLLYAKIFTSCFLITRLDTITSTASSINSASQNNSDCDDEDDGDELVLSDYSE